MKEKSFTFGNKRDISVNEILAHMRSISREMGQFEKFTCNLGGALQMNVMRLCYFYRWIPGPHAKLLLNWN